MGYTNFNVQLDSELYQAACSVLEQYGLTPSQAVQIFFNQIVHTGKVPLSFDWAAPGRLAHQDSLDLQTVQAGDDLHDYSE